MRNKMIQRNQESHYGLALRIWEEMKPEERARLNQKHNSTDILLILELEGRIAPQVRTK